MFLQTSYDLVVSAYSLLELPSTSTRIDTLINLWNKTDKYLVLVEYGTNGGFRVCIKYVCIDRCCNIRIIFIWLQVINEARDFILQITDEHNKGHVFSPVSNSYISAAFYKNVSGCIKHFAVSSFYN